MTHVFRLRFHKFLIKTPHKDRIYSNSFIIKNSNSNLTLIDSDLSIQSWFHVHESQEKQLKTAESR